MAGALGAASVAFADVDPAYSARLLAAALKAYQFAVKYRGLYHDAIPEAASFYRCVYGCRCRSDVIPHGAHASWAIRFGFGV
jgi:hypothetical protein